MLPLYTISRDYSNIHSKVEHFLFVILLGHDLLFYLHYNWWWLVTTVRKMGRYSCDDNLD